MLFDNWEIQPLELRIENVSGFGKKRVVTSNTAYYGETAEDLSYVVFRVCGPGLEAFNVTVAASGYGNRSRSKLYLARLCHVWQFVGIERISRHEVFLSVSTFMNSIVLSEQSLGVAV